MTVSSPTSARDWSTPRDHGGGHAPARSVPSARTTASTMAENLGLVKLDRLMGLTIGAPEIIVGLLDGPVADAHPDLASSRLRTLDAAATHACAADEFSCAHGTYVAGILAAARGSAAPALCPGCTLLVRPIFANAGGGGAVPTATPREVAAALDECIDAGARLVNFSAALTQVPDAYGARVLGAALDRAAERGVILVAAAGNDGVVGGTLVTRHPWVIPVTACDARGRPMLSNLGASIGRHGLRAPGDRITSLAHSGGATRASGTSAAAPFVTGAIALAWSLRPSLAGATVRRATGLAHARRPGLVPPLLDAVALAGALGALQAGGQS